MFYEGKFWRPGGVSVATNLKGQPIARRRPLDTTVPTIFPNVYEKVLAGHLKSKKHKEPCSRDYHLEPAKMKRTTVQLAEQIQHESGKDGNDGSKPSEQESVCQLKCDLLETELEKLRDERKSLNLQLCQAKQEIDSMRKKMLTVETIKDDDFMTKFYTGFSCYPMFDACICFLEPSARVMRYWRGS